MIVKNELDKLKIHLYTFNDTDLFLRVQCLKIPKRFRVLREECNKHFSKCKKKTFARIHQAGPWAIKKLGRAYFLS